MWTSELNRDQLAAVMAPFDKPVAIFAGAGAGKTRTLVCRISQMITAGIKPSTILAITFTRKAAEEMHERLKTYCGLAASTITVCDFHQLCYTMLKQNPFIFGFSRNDFKVADSSKQKKIVKDAVIQFLVTKTRKKEYNSSEVSMLTSQMYKMIGRVKASVLDIDSLEKEQKQVYEYYCNKMRQKRMIDFYDFLTYTKKLLIENQRIADEYRNQYQNVLIDEFQDTSTDNFEIIKLLIGNTSRVTIVGDPRQSIYGFRGASSSNFALFLTTFPSTLKIVLRENYRCTKNILTAAQSMISHSEDFSTLELYSSMSNGEKVVLIPANDPVDEACKICSEIQNITSVEGNYQYRDITVMTRMRRSAADLEIELYRRGIPYKFKHGVKFFMRKEVQEVIAYARLILDDGSDSRMLIAHSLEVVIGEDDKIMAALHNERKYLKDKNISLVAVMPVFINGENKTKASSGLIKEIKSLYGFIQRLKRSTLQNNLSTDQIIRIIIENMRDKDESKRDVLEILVNEAARASKRGVPSRINLENFISNITFESNDVSENVVTLTTIHQMKGLESRVCFVIRVNEGSMPLESPEHECQLEEERRIAYVAMTRAKERLYMSYCKFIKGKLTEPSRFISEIDQSTLRKYSELGHSEVLGILNT